MWILNKNETGNVQQVLSVHEENTYICALNEDSLLRVADFQNIETELVLGISRS